MEDEKARFREIYYSSLLQQRQENATNRIKIALISIGATIAGIVGTIKGIQPLSNPSLLMFILIGGYAPWIYLLYVLFGKLKVDEKVIDEKIATIGTKIEYQDPPSKELADRLDRKFYWSLIISLVGIVCILTYILITAFIMGEQEMSKKETTKEAVIHTTVDRKPTHEQSYGGKLPGFFQPDHAEPNETPNPDREATPPQVTVSEKPTVSENPNQDTNQETKTEQNQ